MSLRRLLFSLILGGWPQLDECQGSCGKTQKLPYACKVAWHESKVVTDVVPRKLCIDYVCSKYTLEV